jgi:hypothetical protein
MRELLIEARLLLRGEVARLPLITCFGLQLDMPVIQRLEHLAKNIEKLSITGFTRDLRSVHVVLLLPVDISQLEEGIPTVKGLSQLLEILLGIANKHGG